MKCSPFSSLMTLLCKYIKLSVIVKSSLSFGNGLTTESKHEKCEKVLSLWNTLTTGIILKKEKTLGDFPGGSMVKNPPSNAGNVGSNHGQGTKIPRALCHSQEFFFF